MAILFSIIIPSYNPGAAIARSIESILKQSFQNFEILVMDGLSDDLSLNIVKSYQDERVKINSQKDEGIYDAMNKGIDKAKGDWLYFLGADDELYDEVVLEEIAVIASEKRRNIIYGNVKIIGDTSWARDGDVYDGIFDLQKLLKKNICHQAIFYRREFVIDNIGYFNLRYRLCGDWDFNLRCFSRARLSYTQKIIAKFYGGGISTSTHVDDNFNSDFKENIFTYFNTSGFKDLVNETGISAFNDVVRPRGKKSYLKYLLEWIKRKIYNF